MDRQPVQSSSLASVGYDSDTSILEVEFRNGTTYQYHGVPQETWDWFISSTSMGQFFVARIRDAYPFARVA